MCYHSAPLSCKINDVSSYQLKKVVCHGRHVVHICGMKSRKIATG